MPLLININSSWQVLPNKHSPNRPNAFKTSAQWAAITQMNSAIL